MDKYGHTREHPNFTLDIDDDYVATLPNEQRPRAHAMQYATAWNMAYTDILQMDYAEFYEATLIHKAVTYRRPWWTGSAGERAYMHERATHRTLPKPRAGNHQF